MKTRTLLPILAITLGTIFSAAAWADRPYSERGFSDRRHDRPIVVDRDRYHRPSPYSRPRVDVDLYIGSPLVRPWYYYPPPPVHSTRIITIPSQTTVYIEKGRHDEPSVDSDYWYYCPSSQTYYPYVKSCREDWLKVVPQAPDHR
ncbi:MAG: hypothetical protein ACFCUG_07240 [Thiotrichales bacterium]